MDAATLETWKSRADVALVILAFLTALAGLASWKLGRLLDAARNAETEKLNTRVQDAEKAQQSSEDRAQKNAEKVRSLEEAAAPRSLSSEALKRLTDSLRGCTAEVSVTAVMGDGEALALAEQIESAFKSAGWTTHGVSVAVLGGDAQGLAIRVPAKDHAPRCAPQVQQAFRDIGFEALGVVVPGASEAVLDVLVARKPVRK
jgi:hypothetical protein